MKNLRSLDSIADDIHKLERGCIFDIGDLLIEAKAQCKHGEWTKWIWDNFEYTGSTAQRYMKAAKLAAKYRTVRYLKIGPATIYQLVGEADEDLPDILKELAKHPIKDRLEADRLIVIGRTRKHYPNQELPDETLWRLGEYRGGKSEIDKKLIAALLEHKPETSAAFVKLHLKVLEQDWAGLGTKTAERPKEEDDAEKEVQALLDGPPPELPPSITPPEPQTIGVDDDDQSAEAETFGAAVEQLYELRGKPLAKFTDVCTPKRLQEVIEFLGEILAMRTKAKEEARS
jgi:hypothetical protein